QSSMSCLLKSPLLATKILVDRTTITTVRHPTTRKYMSSQHSRTRLATIAGIALTTALALTACGSDEESDKQGDKQSAAIPDVEISYEISEETEEVSIDGELNSDQPAAWVISEGDGEPITEDVLSDVHSANIDIENQE